MSLSMYQASVPVLLRGLEQLSHILAKGAAHAEAKKIEPSVFVNARLAPDMFALARQVQIATDNAKGCAARLAGAEVPSYADTETTFQDLHARVAKTIAFVKGFTAAQVDGSEARTVTLKIGGNELKFTGADYLFRLVLPNFYFHITTTYDILRHNGVELGKPDFLGKIQ